MLLLQSLVNLQVIGENATAMTSRHIRQPGLADSGEPLMISMRDVDHCDEFATHVFLQNRNIRHFETMVVMSRIKAGFELPRGK